MAPTGKEYKKSPDPLFGLAILKLAQQLRGEKITGYDSVLQMSMAELGVTQAQLNDYIERNRERLEATLREQGLLKS